MLSSWKKNLFLWLLSERLYHFLEMFLVSLKLELKTAGFPDSKGSRKFSKRVRWTQFRKIIVPENNGIEFPGLIDFPRFCRMFDILKSCRIIRFGVFCILSNRMKISTSRNWTFFPIKDSRNHGKLPSLWRWFFSHGIGEWKSAAISEQKRLIFYHEMATLKCAILTYLKHDT